jgi:hypothetical protein
MSGTKLLLNAYYEALYERLCERRGSVVRIIEELLRDEIEDRGFVELTDSKYQAYRDAVLAFVDERIEMYNPIGIRYTFKRRASKFASELEMQLNWYDSSREFELLRQGAYDKAQSSMSHDKLRQLAGELIDQFGAFPNESIISGYQAQPALNKLPDYIASLAIDHIIRK